MSAVRLAVLGVGNVRCSIPVLVSLATFFGERPLEISLYDADAERLDLFDRFARLCFAATKSSHSLRSTEDPAEALQGADKVIVQLDANCARKYLGKPRSEHDWTLEALDKLLPQIPQDAEVVNLLFDRDLPHLEGYVEMEWPGNLTEAEERAVPHQILRLLNGEEYLHELFKEHSSNPLRSWLDLPVAQES